jgi:hypothetical protein
MTEGSIMQVSPLAPFACLRFLSSTAVRWDGYMNQLEEGRFDRTFWDQCFIIALFPISTSN